LSEAEVSQELISFALEALGVERKVRERTPPLVSEIAEAIIR